MYEKDVSGNRETPGAGCWLPAQAGEAGCRTQRTPNVCTYARAPNDAILNMKLLKPQKCGNDFLGQNCLVLCP